MGDLMAAKFSDLESAHGAATALAKQRGLGATIYASAILYRNSHGRIAVTDRTEDEEHATAVAAFIGALAGVAVSPLGVVAGAIAGALVGIATESTDRDARAELLEKVSHAVRLNNAVLMADVAPADTASLRALIQDLGGTFLHPPNT